MDSGVFLTPRQIYYRSNVCWLCNISFVVLEKLEIVLHWIPEHQ